LRANLDKNRRDRDARGYIDQRHRECEERELRHRLDYDREYAPSGTVHRIMERKDCDRHDVGNKRRAQYEADYGHPEVGSLTRIASPDPRSWPPVQDKGATQVGDNDDDMVVTAFPTLVPRLRSVAYPDNFKPNIQ
jgi:hypothetical protein